MMEVLKFGSILLCILGSSLSQTNLGGSDSQFFMTEIVRVKRQAGYVYNRPSVSFDLPPRPPPSPPSTQAPTVDRAQTQAQMMYYAYPAPAAQPSGSPLSPGATAGQQTSGGTSGGYNYAPQTGGGQASESAGQQPSSGGASSGYNYSPQNVGVQSSLGSASGSAGGSAQSEGGRQGSQGSGAAGYSYSSPTAGTGSAVGSQASTSSSLQTSSSASSQTNTGSQAGTISGSGYSYQVPNRTLQPNLQTEVSTNAPKYLPPTGSTGGGASVGTGDGGIQAPSALPPPPPATSSSGGYGGARTGQSAKPAPPTDQYLPPLLQTENPNDNSVVNTGNQAGSFPSAPSAAYIPPAGARPSPAADATPRPFAPPPLSTAGYLPPNVNTDTSSGRGSLSTPASTYLPPVL